MTSEEMKQALKELGVFQIYGYRLEARALPQILEMDEQLYGITSGVYQGRRWLAAATGQHVYLVAVHLVSGTEVKKIERSQISSVSAKRGIFFAKVFLSLQDGHQIILEHTAKASTDRFLWAVQRKAEDPDIQI